MFYRSVRPHLLIAFLGLFILSACATPENNVEKSTKKVFIAKVKIGDDLLERTTRKFRNVGKSSANQERPLRKSDITKQADKLHKTLKATIGQNYVIVSSSGKGVFVIETTLTDLNANRATLGDFDGRPGLSNRSRYAGGAAIDVSISRNNEIVDTFSDSYQGRLDNPTRRESYWGDADFAFRKFARQLSRFIG